MRALRRSPPRGTATASAAAWRALLFHLLLASMLRAAAAAEDLRLARFSADVTVPIGHRLMGVLPVKAREIVDPLSARGLVLLGAGEPIVIAVVDWCEIRNDAYARWREGLAEAAGTRPGRVLVAAVHQHDAPVADLGAERLLAEVGLAGELCDSAFHKDAVRRAAAALRASLPQAAPLTHLGLGKALVERLASNRRVVRAGGTITFDRGSASGGDPELAAAPEGLIDPWVRALSFWDGDRPLAAVHVYAVHPMSYYGRGGVSADFVGEARRRLEAETPGVLHLYASGASGDVTAGKHNDGAPASRPLLAARLHAAMAAAWRGTKRLPLRGADFRVERLELPFAEGEDLTAAALRRRLKDRGARVEDRVLAALGLASRLRVERGEPIDVPSLDLGWAQVVLLPGEAFVGFQLMAQRLRPDSFVLTIGYGECWPGYIPTREAFAEGFGRSWRWVGRGAAERLRAALWRLLRATPPALIPAAEGGDLARDPFPATAANPRYSEGSIAALDDGSLLYATTEFIGAADDFAPARIVARRSPDGGESWGPLATLQENVGRRNVMSVSLRQVRSAVHAGLAMFYLVKESEDDLRVWMRLSPDGGRSFAAPVLVTAAAGYHVMNNDRVAELADGRLIAPVAWTRDVRRENHFVSFAYLSDDGGATWRAGAGRVDLPRRGAMEPEVVELADGGLLMILRTQLGEIHAARSEDRGETWSAPAPWGVPSPESPATLRVIPVTGSLLLVWNPEVEAAASHGGPRTPLAAAISRDEGRTWTRLPPLEARADERYAYTSLTFTAGRALLGYYVEDAETGRISSRFRSLALEGIAGSAR